MIFGLVFLFLLSFNALADEKVEEIVAYTPHALEFAGVEFYSENISEFSIHIDPQGHIVYILKQNQETLAIQCHYHSGGDTHCLATANEVTLPGDFRELINVSGNEIHTFFNGLGVEVSSMDASLWPWVFGVLISYYFAKKAVNYWIHRSFSLKDIKEHGHNHFFIEPNDQLQERVQKESDLAESKLDRLKEINHQSMTLFTNKGEDLKVLLNDKLLSLSGAIIEELKKEHHHSCSGCSDHNHSSFIEDQATSDQSLKIEIDTSDSKLVDQLNLSRSKKTVSNGVIIKYAKALIFDLKNEFIDPFTRAAKGAFGVLFNSDKRRQVNSFAQTHYRIFLGEAHLAVATTIASVMVTIKVLGETLETMLVGPLHVICQISDMAAITTGLTMLVTYHCLRQPVRKKDPALLLKRNFWHVLLSKLKKPFNTEITESNLKVSHNGLEVFISKINKIKKSLNSLIWLLRYDQKLSPSTANSLALRLGKLNKIFENTDFDIQVKGKTLSGEELLQALKSFIPVVESYNSLHLEILSEANRSSSTATEALTCSGLLAKI